MPWALVQSLYENLQRLNPEIQIVDITSWTSWEAETEADGSSHPRPSLRNTADLAHHCRVSRVITIDTALVHLAPLQGRGQIFTQPVFR